ncbi:MAG: hypothetical protein ACKO8Q_00880 [Bacteroidota bacterium]
MHAFHKVIPTLLLISICFVTFSQTDSAFNSEPPPPEIVFSDTVMPIPPPPYMPENWNSDASWPTKKMTSLLGLDIGLISLRSKYGNRFSSDYPLKTNLLRSFSLRLNLFHKKIQIKENLFGVAAALGFAHEQLNFRSATVFQSAGPTGFYINDSLDFKTNQYRRSGIYMPVLLEFNTQNDNNNHKNFRVAAGAGVSYYFAQHGLSKYYLNNNTVVESRLKNVYGNQVVFGEFHLRMSYKKYTFFLTVPFNSIFTQVNAFPITFGLNANTKFF